MAKSKPEGNSGKELSQESMHEMHMIEQGLQNTLMQKQAFQMELNEAKAALKELEKSGDEVFKIIGQLLIKSDRNKVKEELQNKEKIIDLRLKSLEKQEKNLMDRLSEIRKEFS